MSLDGIHHVTCITGDAPAERRLLHARARPAARQEDGQPGRPDRLPPLLRATSRAARGSDITFFEYPGARRGRAGAGMMHTIALRVGVGGGARLLGAPPRRRGRRRVARATAACGSTTRRACGLELGAVADGRRAARRRAPRDPGRAGAAGLRQRARVRGRARARAAPCSRRRSASSPLDGASRWEVRGESRGGVYAYDSGRPSAAVGGAGHGPSRRLVVDDGRP